PGGAAMRDSEGPLSAGHRPVDDTTSGDGHRAPGRAQLTVKPSMRVQRAAAPGADPAPATAPGAGASADPAAPSDAMIVEDQAQRAGGQMPGVRFLNQWHEQAIAPANDALGPVWSAVGCPYIESWFSRHAAPPAAELDQLARRYSGIARPRAAADYISPILARIRNGIARWQAVEDVASDAAAAAPGPGAAPPPQ